MYINKEQRLKASLELDRMVNATQLMGWGWGGVGWDVKAPLELDRMVNATQLLGPRCVEGRGVFTKRKILGITKCALLQWDLDKHLNVGLEASKIGVQKLLCFGNM